MARTAESKAWTASGSLPADMSRAPRLPHTAPAAFWLGTSAKAALRPCAIYHAAVYEKTSSEAQAQLC